MTTTSPGAGEADRVVDRLAAVDDSRAPPSRPAPVGDRGDDRLRILAARVVGGDDDDVGVPRGRRAHQRALAAVAVAAGADDDDQRARVASSRAVRRTLSSASGLCA